MWWEIAAVVFFTFVLPVLIYAYLIARPLNFFKPNFFEQKIDGEASTLELDRHKNYQNRIHAHNLPEGEFDHIIVGSGMSGLTTARVLTTHGDRVLVLEANEKIGGQMHVYKDVATDSCPSGAEFDVGLHYTSAKSSKIPLYQWLFGEDIKWNQLDYNFDTVGFQDKHGEMKSLPMVNTQKKEFWENFLARCEELEPGNKNRNRQALIKLQILEDKAAGCSLAFMLKMMPVWLVNWLWYIPFALKVLTAFVEDYGTLEQVMKFINCSESFKILYYYHWGNIGIVPKETSFFLFVLMHRSQRISPGYPVGGCIPMIHGMTKKINAVKNSQLFTHARVVDVEIKNKKATGVYVQLRDGPQLISCKKSVIFSSGIIPTFEKILKNHVNLKTNKQYLEAKQHQITDWGYSVCFITLKKSPSFPKKNFWVLSGQISQNSREEHGHHAAINQFLKTNHPDDAGAEFPILFISFPSAKDPTFHDADRFPNTSTCQMISSIPNKWIQDLEYQGIEYNAIKEIIGQKMYQQALDYFEQHEVDIYADMEENLENISVSTPKTFDRYINSEYGQMYGIGAFKDCYNLRGLHYMRPEVIGFENVYLTGQDIVSDGFTSAITSGFMTCSVILDRNLLVEEQVYCAKLKKSDICQQGLVDI